MRNRPKEVFRIEDAINANISRKVVDSSLEAMRESIAIREEISRSQLSVAEYMNMSRHFDDFGSGNVRYSEAVERLSKAVEKQDIIVKATAQAINSLQTKVPDGPIHINHCIHFKAMDVYKPYEINMQNSTYTVNLRYLGVSELDELNFKSVLDVFNTYTPIGLGGFGNSIPVWYEFLGKTFAVWDKGSEDLVHIFRCLYKLRNPEDFKCYCMSLGYTCKTVFGHGSNVLDGDTVIYPKRVRGKFVGGLGDVSRIGRVHKNTVESIRPFFDSVEVDEEEYNNRILEARLGFVRKDVVGISSAQQSTMTEEIEQRLIEKYLN